MNWKNVITELKGYGLSQDAVATECNSTQTTINDLNCGRSENPLYPLGVALLGLLERCRAGEFGSEKKAKSARL